MKSIILASLLLLGACATSQDTINKATAACGLNGGVTEIKHGYKTVTAICGNGAEFKFGDLQ